MLRKILTNIPTTQAESNMNFDFIVNHCISKLQKNSEKEKYS